MKISASVLGASGFAGGELLRLLSQHPAFEVVGAGAGTLAGEPVPARYPGLVLGADATFVTNEEALAREAEVVFISLPHTESMKLAEQFAGRKAVDLGGDFRLSDPGQYEKWYGTPHLAPDALGRWVYGLTEFNRTAIEEAKLVANPGCYPAASILALGPFLEAGLIEPVPIHIDAKSGVSGAGRASGEGFGFASANENTRPYRPVGHNHIPEIEEQLSAVAGGTVTVSFVPHLVPMTRGIEVTAVALATGGATAQGLQEALAARYEKETFIRVLGGDGLPETRRLTGTNFAEVAVRMDDRTGKVLLFAALDNLGKGAAGQAVQNANLIFGFDESMGLQASAVLP
ncbi:MAG: N-acetyl-gamma-glutamyl-phosphate reductase [Actinomycetota bacterium]